MFAHSGGGWAKAELWSRRKEEFVKRAGLALMAYLAVHGKQANNARFVKLLPMIRREARDERNFVRKAVNWALRQIGKRNSKLNRAAIIAAEPICQLESDAARWIAGDALRELTSDAVRRRLKAKAVRSHG